MCLNVAIHILINLFKYTSSTSNLHPTFFSHLYFICFTLYFHRACLLFLVFHTCLSWPATYVCLFPPLFSPCPFQELLLNVFAEELQRRRLNEVTEDDVFDVVRSVMRRCKGEKRKERENKENSFILASHILDAHACVHMHNEDILMHTREFM